MCDMMRVRERAGISMNNPVCACANANDTLRERAMVRYVTGDGNYVGETVGGLWV